ncbi:hypothetical protein JCM8547_001255 [Rhodosporidiobolus lusitaniae]
MLLSLPTELVQHTVRLSLPEDITGNTYAERQATLSALCLVSKNLRNVVQPMLDEVRWFGVARAIKGQSKEEKTAIERVAGRLKTLGWEATSTTRPEVLPFLPLLTALRWLCLSSVELDLGALSSSAVNYSDGARPIELLEAVQALKAKKHNVRRIYLPLHLAPSSLAGKSSLRCVEALLAACDVCGIEAIFAHFERDYLSSTLPQEFIEFTSERNARLQAEKTKQGQQ